MMNSIPAENPSFLPIDWNNYREMEDALSDSGTALKGNSEYQIPRVSTLDELSEITSSVTRMNAAKQNAYNSFRHLFLEINNFIQSSKKSNEKNILYACYEEAIDHGGQKKQAIVLYSRPRSSNLFIRFLDWALYSDQEELAQKFLLRFLKSAPTAEPSDVTESQDAGGNINKLPCNALPWIYSMKGMGPYPLAKDNLSAVKYSSFHFSEIANQIDKQMQTEKERDKEKNGRMFDCIAWDDEFFNWKPNYNNPDVDEYQDEILVFPEELKAFQSEKIKAFNDLVENIKKLNFGNASPEKVQEIFDFCTTWVNSFNSRDKQGDVFRNNINKSSKLRAWNVAAHYIALRDHPYVIKKEADGYTLFAPSNSEDQQVSAPFDPAMMNFRHYEKNTRIMVPPLNEIYFPRQTIQEQAIFYQLNAGDEEFRESNQSIEVDGQVLTAYKHLKISENLKPDQEAELFSVYQEFIKAAIKDNEKIVLTPVFNYTEHAIDRCIDAVITPIVTQKAINGELPEIRFFSPDPRITEKFDLAISNPEHYMALRAADKAAKLAMQKAPGHGLDRLQLQHGILLRDMTDPGMIMMHASAGRYGATDERTTDILEGFAKKPLFAKAALAGTAIPRTRKKTQPAGALTPHQPSNTTNRRDATSVATGKKELISTTQFIMPTSELHLDQSVFHTLSSLLGPETLSPEQIETIRKTYTQVFRNAKEKEIRTLVLIPCFDLEQENSLREQACAEMLDVIDKLLASNPDMTVKMALASQSEFTLLQQQIVRQEKTGRQVGHKDT